MKSISLYVDQDTFLTRMHPYTKLLYILTAIITSILIGNWWVYMIFIAISIALLISGRVIQKTLPLIAFSFTIIVTMFLIHGLFYHANQVVLFQIGPLKFYREGLYYALKIGLNILNMLLSFAVFVLTTKPSAFVEELEKTGFSPKFGYIIISVFQIIPQMSGSMSTIMDAQRSRGMETEGSLWVRAKAFLPLISPVVMSSLINTRERAIALEIRGFGGNTKKTYLSDRKRQKIDRPLTLLFFIIIAGAVVWKIYQWMQH